MFVFLWCVDITAYLCMIWYAHFVSVTYTAFAVAFIILENKYINFLCAYGIFETIYLKDFILQV